jgi:4-hydroxy-2-oxoheptanedioate aldolase
MKTNQVRVKLKRGEPSIGTWLTLPDPLTARLMASTGFDWLTVEMEHTSINFESVGLCFPLIVAGGAVPLVRVPWNTGENIKRVLDMGAWGIVVPMIKSRQEAEAVVEAARYAPLGNRSIGGQMHAVNFDTDPATYYARANDEILVVLMAEHVKAIESIDEILSVPGVDVVFIGPNDLHNSMGKKPAFDSDDPEFVDAVKLVLKTARKYGVAPGIHVADAMAARRRREEGFQFIAIASEAAMLMAKAREITQSLGMAPSKEVVKY